MWQVPGRSHVLSSHNFAIPCKPAQDAVYVALTKNQPAIALRPRAHFATFAVIALLTRMAFANPGLRWAIFHLERTRKKVFTKLFSTSVLAFVSIDPAYRTANCLGPLSEAGVSVGQPRPAAFTALAFENTCYHLSAQLRISGGVSTLLTSDQELNT